MCWVRFESREGINDNITLIDLTGIVHLNIQLIQHGKQLLLTSRLLLPLGIQQAKAIIPSTQTDASFHRNVVSINLGLEPIAPPIQQGHPELGAVDIALFPHQIFQVARPMRSLGIGPEADLNGRQDGGLSGAILAVNEVDVAAEVHGEGAMAHEVLDGDGRDDTGFGRRVGRVGVARGNGRVVDGGIGGAPGRSSSRAFGVLMFGFFVVVVGTVVFFGGGLTLDSFRGRHDW